MKTSLVVVLPPRKEPWIVSAFTVVSQWIPFLVCYTFLTAIIANTLQGTQNACRVKAEQETAVALRHYLVGFGSKGEAGGSHE